MFCECIHSVNKHSLSLCLTQAQGINSKQVLDLVRFEFKRERETINKGRRPGRAVRGEAVPAAIRMAEAGLMGTSEQRPEGDREQVVHMHQAEASSKEAARAAPQRSNNAHDPSELACGPPSPSPSPVSGRPQQAVICWSQFPMRVVIF